MNSLSFNDQIFNRSSFANKPPARGEYEGCRFVDCDFSNTDFGGYVFIDCKFENSNLSLVKSSGTVMSNVKFSDCKMLGFRFDDCNQSGLSVSFENCNLTHSSFCKTVLKKTTFRNVNLTGTDFTGSDISNSDFFNCDFAGAIFDNTKLEKANLCSSYNYIIDPETNRIKKARFSSDGLKGLLNKYDIETV